MKSSALGLALLLLACESRTAIRDEPVALRELDTNTTAATPSATGPKKLPILGDPLGLLSRPPEPVKIAPPSIERRRLDPGALSVMRSSHASEERTAQREPRAVARARESERPMPSASTEIRDVTPSAFANEVRGSSAKLRVLYLYAAYCPACREVMPTVRAAAKRFHGQGVVFSAASVDRDRDAYAAYVPTLEGVFPATLMASDGTTVQELKKLGIPLEGQGFAIPLVAVFDQSDRLVAYGNTNVASRLEKTLAPLLEK